MALAVHSFAKVNLGLRIGPRRTDGFHELRTVYQTLALHDVIKIDVKPGMGIEIRSKDPRVPTDESNTCYRMTERVLKALKVRKKVTLCIEKRLPVEGGVGGASSNAVATMLGLERALKVPIPAEVKLRLAAETGSDVPLFLVGGTVLGLGRGEDVYPLPDLPALDCVLVAPEVGISTPRAFADWDKLTASDASDTMNEFSRSVWSWLCGPTTGVPARSGDRAEALLLDLVRAGIENDFERVVFPQHSELREVKRALERAGASFASLSGSGSSLFGLFPSSAAAEKAAKKLSADGLRAVATKTLPREEYWKKLWG
ncbi:MAG: 4-(cytidine 5'-diphospho)-2-C-methyl-D-erythritol kinase [Candidatus Koribacter versatilis]|uniref:4-diphosphocytidyl-2-C-methyl-D-erythritol kinase n=1 Tax=Candidatus Korobacter versatilis TaxID=658062 RepID=A0A932EPM6_9BACT|nr:4-(cytidine 5'-diphospho)-2-C-methyl-D-erythritol kinase [Candidatus Koribacter versatilis]